MCSNRIAPQKPEETRTFFIGPFAERFAVSLSLSLSLYFFLSLSLSLRDTITWKRGISRDLNEYDRLDFSERVMLMEIGILMEFC